MASKRGKFSALAALSIGVVVLAASGYAFRGRIIESWHLHRLGSEDPAVQEHAAVRLAELGSARAVPRLIEILLAEGWRFSTTHFSAEALIRIGEPAIEAILAKFRAGNGKRTPELFQFLHLFDPETVPYLTAALFDDDKNVRILAVQFLYECGPDNPDILPDLVRAIEDEEPMVSAVAIAAIHRMREMAEAAIPVLFAKLDDPSADVSLRDDCARALASISPNAAMKLIDRLDHHDPVVRRISVRALGLIGQRYEEIFRAIRGALADEDVEVRRSAMKALARIGTPASDFIPDLESALCDPELMDAAIHALLMIDPREAFQTLLEDFAAKDWRLIGNAEHIIRLNGPQVLEALPDLLDALGAADAAVRRDACRAIGAMFPPARAAVPALTERSQSDPDAEVRREALLALEKIQPP